LHPLSAQESFTKNSQKGRVKKEFSKILIYLPILAKADVHSSAKIAEKGEKMCAASSPSSSAAHPLPPVLPAPVAAAGPVGTPTPVEKKTAVEVRAAFDFQPDETKKTLPPGQLMRLAIDAYNEANPEKRIDIHSLTKVDVHSLDSEGKRSDSVEVGVVKDSKGKQKASLTVQYQLSITDPEGNTVNITIPQTWHTDREIPKPGTLAEEKFNKEMQTILLCLKLKIKSVMNFSQSGVRTLSDSKFKSLDKLSKFDWTRDTFSNYDPNKFYNRSIAPLSVGSLAKANQNQMVTDYYVDPRLFPWEQKEIRDMKDQVYSRKVKCKEIEDARQDIEQIEAQSKPPVRVSSEGIANIASKRDITPKEAYNTLLETAIQRAGDSLREIEALSLKREGDKVVVPGSSVEIELQYEVALAEDAQKATKRYVDAKGERERILNGPPAITEKKDQAANKKWLEDRGFIRRDDQAWYNRKTRAEAEPATPEAKAAEQKEMAVRMKLLEVDKKIEEATWKQEVANKRAESSKRVCEDASTRLETHFEKLQTALRVIDDLTELAKNPPGTYTQDPKLLEANKKLQDVIGGPKGVETLKGLIEGFKKRVTETVSPGKVFLPKAPPPPPPAQAAGGQQPPAAASAPTPAAGGSQPLPPPPSIPPSQPPAAAQAAEGQQPEARPMGVDD